MKKEKILHFLEMRCNIFEIIYFDPSPPQGERESLPVGRQG
jgi:hypothetical protein